GAWTWRRTGVLLGLVGAVAWPLAMLVERPFGLSIIPGSVDLVRTIGGAMPSQAGFGAWDVLLVLGIALGALIAARKDGSGKWSVPSGQELARKISGGLGLGAGASLAGGCTVGHGLTGVSLLAPGSLVTLAAIFAGSLLTTVGAPRPGAASKAA
ncbi:MAG: YeeE/YedE family protein, partial [Gammaproteobacteria bacterium]|nr:YeeE/YedE family protein [Gammaproteobacteria bacterium]